MADQRPLQSLNNPHFFQPLLPGFHSHINIPVAFFSKHMEGRNDQNRTAKLRSDASDKTWIVKMEGLKLTHGWEEFAVAHDLRTGDIIVFRHEGRMVFHVTALGPSCCQIQYTPPHNINRQTKIAVRGNSSRKRRVKKIPRTKVESSFKQKSRFVAKVSASSLANDRLYLPRSFTRSNGLNKMCAKKIVLEDQEGRSWNLDLKHDKTGMQTFVRPGWRRFCAANGMHKGHCTFKMVRESETPVVRLCRAQHRPKSESESKSSSHHSFFERSATLSSLQQDTLYLPKRFVRSNGLDKGCSEIVLKNERGGRWTLLLKRYDSRTYLRGGWTSFCQDNGIKAGDSFKLQLVGSGERPVLSLCPADSNRDHHSHDVKPISSKPSRGDDKSTSEESENDQSISEEFLERKNCSRYKASSSFSQNHFVTLTLTLNAFKTYKMVLPRGFTRTNGINRPGKITLLGQDGVKQAVDLFQDKRSGTMRLGKGWREFCEAQGVKIGDTFVLELFWENDASPVLKFFTKLNSV